MLKKRVIPVLLLQNGRMVKGIRFADYRDTGSPATAIRIYSAQDADELVFLDIQASVSSRKSLLDIIREASRECFMPLAAGGGITSVDEVRELLAAGADKVVITTAAYEDPSLISKVAQRFGSQCVVAGIDYRRGPEGEQAWVRCGTQPIGAAPVALAQRFADLGAGEILLNSIDRDGTMSGYDLDFADRVADAVAIPVVACGGAGNFAHLADLLKGTAVSGAACASIFHFGDNNPIRARSFLRNAGVPCRVLK